MAKGHLTKIMRQAAVLWYNGEAECVLCGRIGEGKICFQCRNEYFRLDAKRCDNCGKLIGDKWLQCKDCSMGKGPRGLDRVIALGCYDGLWKEYIHRIKYKGQPYLLEHIHQDLVSLTIRSIPPPDAVVPVPMHQRKLMERGFNQAEIIASILSKKLGIYLNNCLDRITDTLPQTTLGRKDRIKNLKGAFQIKNEIEITEEIIWLVDDVTTTGATLDECASILKGNGVKKIYAVCLGAAREE